MKRYQEFKGYRTSVFYDAVGKTFVQASEPHAFDAEQRLEPPPLKVVSIQALPPAKRTSKPRLVARAGSAAGIRRRLPI